MGINRGIFGNSPEVVQNEGGEVRDMVRGEYWESSIGEKRGKVVTLPPC